MKTELKDLLLGLILFLAGFSGSYMGAEMVDLEDIRADDVWFQADIGRVYSNMTNRYSNHYRTKVHPLFSIATNPFVEGIHRLGITKQSAVQLYVAVAAGIWLVLIFSILRLLSLARFDAVLFSMLAAVSASALFWLTVPETYLFGSLTMLMVSVFVIISSNRPFSPGWHVLISAASLSMTVTNWMTGILATVLNHSWKRSIFITLGAFLLVSIIWVVQHAVYTSSEFFLFSAEEKNYVLIDAAGGFIEKTLVFFLYTILMPSVQILDNPFAPGWPLFSIQFAPISSLGILGMTLMSVWIGLLLVGVWSALRMGSKQTKFRLFLGLTLLGQFGLHQLYGDETFLYSLHWLPFLVILAAIGVFSPYRRYVLIAACLLTVVGGIHNFNQFATVTSELSNNTYSSDK